MPDDVLITPGSGERVAADEVLGGDGVMRKHQRVKVVHGVDGSATDVSGANPLPVTGTMAVDTELPAAAVTADGQADSSIPPVGARGQVWNGTTWDRQRGNTEYALLGSTARTASTFTPVQTNHNARGVVIYWRISAVGAGGLGADLRIYAYDPSDWHLLFISAVYTTPAIRAFIVYPGVGAPIADVRATVSLPLPRSWVCSVNHLDAVPITYSLSCALIV